MTHSVRDVIDGYIKIRDQRDELRRKQQDDMKPLTEKMKTLENWLLGELTKTEGDSISVKGVGTVFKSVRTSSKVTDWDETLPYIQQHELWHMLERRVSKAALEEFMEANGEPLPGVAITREIIVNIRRN